MTEERLCSQVSFSFLRIIVRRFNENSRGRPIEQRDFVAMKHKVAGFSPVSVAGVLTVISRAYGIEIWQT